MTRLEEHRRQLEAAGRLGPLLRADDLLPDELELVNRTFLSFCRERGVTDLDGLYGAYVSSLHTWGVMCPHPQMWRRYDGLYSSDYPQPFSESTWFTCSLCGSAVINR